jgi:hypothetical protein
MTPESRSTVAVFAVAGISVILAVTTGVGSFGKPLRLVQLVTIVGLSMTAGASCA